MQPLPNERPKYSQQAAKASQELSQTCLCAAQLPQSNSPGPSGMHIDCSAASRAVSSLRQNCPRAAPRCLQKGSEAPSELHHCFSKATADVVLSQDSPAQNCSESWSEAVSRDVPNVCRAALLQGCTDFPKELQILRHRFSRKLLRSWSRGAARSCPELLQSSSKAAASLLRRRSRVAAAPLSRHSIPLQRLP